MYMILKDRHLLHIMQKKKKCDCFQQKWGLGGNLIWALLHFSLTYQNIFIEQTFIIIYCLLFISFVDCNHLV